MWMRSLLQIGQEPHPTCLGKKCFHYAQIRHPNTAASRRSFISRLAQNACLAGHRTNGAMTLARPQGYVCRTSALSVPSAPRTACSYTYCNWVTRSLSWGIDGWGFGDVLSKANSNHVQRSRENHIKGLPFQGNKQVARLEPHAGRRGKGCLGQRVPVIFPPVLRSSE